MVSIQERFLIKSGLYDGACTVIGVIGVYENGNFSLRYVLKFSLCMPISILSSQNETR